MNNLTPPPRVLVTFKELEDVFEFESGLHAFTFAQENELTFDLVQELPREEETPVLMSQEENPEETEMDDFFDFLMNDLAADEAYTAHQELKKIYEMENRLATDLFFYLEE
jgi:hypothetical protein